MAKLRSTIATFKPNRGLGSDHWAPRELLALPAGALQALADRLNEVATTLNSPPQMLHNLIALKPKPAGGDRPLRLATSYYCIFTGAHGEPIREWDSAMGGFWDDALRNCSALRAAYHRRVLEESTVATSSGATTSSGTLRPSTTPCHMISFARQLFGIFLTQFS